jgi:hypothetical protein
MVIFNSYVKLPEGRNHSDPELQQLQQLSLFSGKFFAARAKVQVGSSHRQTYLVFHQCRSGIIYPLVMMKFSENPPFTNDFTI